MVKSKSLKKTKQPKLKTDQIQPSTIFNDELAAEMDSTPASTTNKVEECSKKTKDSVIFENDEAAATALKKHNRILDKFSIDSDFKIQNLIGTDNHINEMEINTIVDKLLSYANMYASWKKPEYPLHSPSRVYGHIWDKMSVYDKNELREAIISKYMSISTMKRETFESVLKEAKKLSQGTNSANDEINHLKLIAMNSNEIPMSGTKLTKQTSPQELAIFIDSMKRAVTQRPNWLRALTIKLHSTTNKKKKKEIFLLSAFRQIDLLTLKKLDFHKSTSIKDASISMYKELSATMSNQFRGEMRLYKDTINNQGPKLLWFILNKLTLKHTRIIADITSELETLKDAFVSSKYDVHKICPILYDCLMNFKDAGGNIENQYILVSSALLSCNVDSFILLVREWEQSQLRTIGKKCVFELLQAIPDMVDDLIASNEWPHKQLGKKVFLNYLPKDSKVPKKSKESSDLTAFLGQFKSAISTLTKTTAAAANLASKPNGGGKRKHSDNLPAKVTSGKYSYCSDCWGPDKHYKNESQFKAFYNGTSIKDKDQVYMLDGTKWSWCQTCGRMGNHLTQKHMDRKKRQRGNNT
jgi:hypothetical protein